ncbi:MAG: hypothetical protein H6850_00240 [Alphaproteobacteria bacterium]|nr:MAG: hypothetical protein H6850_00240 [Alphaproteobacteria bacterium]
MFFTIFSSTVEVPIWDTTFNKSFPVHMSPLSSKALHLPQSQRSAFIQLTYDIDLSESIVSFLQKRECALDYIGSAEIKLRFSGDKVEPTAQVNHNELQKLLKKFQERYPV